MNERKRTIIAVYGSGLLLGIALILFPSAGPLFTDPERFNLSSAQFGMLFTPQIAMGIVASLLAAPLARRWSLKWVMVLGLSIATLAMLLLASSELFVGAGNLAFGVLLAAAAAMGAGFGLSISALNAFAFDLFPGKQDAAVTAVHATIGVGLVLAALLFNLFLGSGRWWGAPLATALAIVIMAVFLAKRPLNLSSEQQSEPAERTPLPARIRLFAAIVFLYGAIEGTFATWTPIYLADNGGFSVAQAAFGLSLFWGSVTLGRVLFAALATRANLKPLFYVTPLVAGAMLLVLPTLNALAANYAALIIAGLALSYSFPYTISLASTEFPMLATIISGVLVAAVQLGLGVSANLVGLGSQWFGLDALFRLSALYALAMIILMLVVYPLHARPVAEHN